MQSWAQVEKQLQRIASRCVSSRDKRTLSAGFFSIRSASAKLLFCSGLVEHKFFERPQIANWEGLLKDGLRLNGKRNKIAHFVQQEFLKGTSGNRVALVQWESGQPIPESSVRSRKTPPKIAPPTAIKLKDLFQTQAEFRSYAEGLKQFADLIAGKQTPPPTPPAPHGSPITLDSIRRQIRAALEPPP